MESLKKNNERLIYEDVIVRIGFSDDETKEPIPDPLDFNLRFYVQDRTEEFICSRQGGGTPINCSIEEGKVVCCIPKDTFHYCGNLILEDMDAVACSGFGDGDYESIGRWDTTIDYIE